MLLQVHSIYKYSGSIIIGTAVPLVRSKLAERIKAGDFVDMAEFLPECMGTPKYSSTDKSSKQKFTRCSVSSIIEWV